MFTVTLHIIVNNWKKKNPNVYKRKTDKEIVIYSYNGIKILRYMQQHAWVSKTQYCMREARNENMCCDSIYMKFKAGKINYGNKNQNRGCLSVCVCVWGVAVHKWIRKGPFPQQSWGPLGGKKTKDDSMLLVLEKGEMTAICRKSRLALSRILYLSWKMSILVFFISFSVLLVLFC